MASVLFGRDWLATAVLLGWAVGFLTPTAAAQTANPPNFVIVLVDDMRWDDYGAAGHPFVETPNIDRVAREGATFLNAFAATPLCSPSRANFLTGRYAHANGIIDNTERGPASHQLRTFPQELQRAGYETAFVGKWHMGNDDMPRPGFDYWLSFRGQGSSLRPELNENGTREKVQGYITDILTERAIRFLDRPRSKPFLLYLAHKAIHPNVGGQAGGPGFIPAERHRGKYADTRIPRRPNAGVPPRDKPALWRQIDNLPMLGRTTMTSDDDIRGRLESLLAIDEGLGQILESLQRSGRLDDTVVVVAGDHGYFYGEHGLNAERRFAYEESARIPLVVRHPRTVKAGTTPKPLVLSVDLAPTILELAGATQSDRLHGRSLVPLLKGLSVPWRTSVLIEYFTDRVFPRAMHMGYKAVRTERFKYIQYVDLKGMDEMYDLEADPYELNNLLFYEPSTGYRVPSPSHRSTLEDMRVELSRLLAETDAAAPETTRGPALAGLGPTAKREE